MIDSDEVFPSIKQAQDLRHYSKEGRFNADIVTVILNQEKPMESKRLGLCAKTLEAKLKKLNDQSKKDNIVTFEELGVDRLMVDEAHYFENLFLVTKMRNVSGIA